MFCLAAAPSANMRSENSRVSQAKYLHEQAVKLLEAALNREENQSDAGSVPTLTRTLT